MRKPLRRHFFCRRKTNIGRHLRRHCRMPPPIPMAVEQQKLARKEKALLSPCVFEAK